MPLGGGLFHITVRLGFMQRPDVPLTLRNCELLGFDVNLDDTHYFIGHETVRLPGARRGRGWDRSPFDILPDENRQSGAGFFPYSAGPVA